MLDLLFQWIALVKENKDQFKFYHDELRQISRINFKFRENGDPSDFVSNAAEALFDEKQPLSNLLCGSSLSSEYDPDVTTRSSFLRNKDFVL